MLGSSRKQDQPRVAEEGSVVHAIGQMADGLGRLFTESLHLAQVELKEDVKGIAKDAAKIALFGLVALLGYVLLCFAGAWGLAKLIGPGLGFLAVGGLHLIGGAVGAWLAIKSLSQKPEHLLEQTRGEVTETMQELKSLKDSVPDSRALVPIPTPQSRIDATPPRTHTPAPGARRDERTRREA